MDLSTLRLRLLMAVGFLALLLVAFAFGRFSAPKPEIQIQEKVVTQEKLVVDQKAVETEVQRRLEAMKLDKTKETVRTVVVTKDGTRTETDTTKENLHQETVKTEIQYVDRIAEKVVDRIVTQEVEKKVVVQTPLAQWQVGAQIGLTPNRVRLTPTGIQTGDLALGLQVQRRIVGPLWAGAYGQWNGTVGVVIGIEF